jgi:hypothetical protein
MSVVVRQLIDASGNLDISHPPGPVSVFALPALLRMWQTQLGWTGLGISSGELQLLGFVKSTAVGKIFFSMPYGGYGGIIGKGSHEEHGDILDWLRQQRYLQENLVQFSPIAFEYPESYYRNPLTSHVLQLSQSGSYSDNATRNLRKAQASGLQIRRLDSSHKPACLALLADHQARSRELRRLPTSCYEYLLDQVDIPESGISAFGAFAGSDLHNVHIYFQRQGDAFYFDGFSSAVGLDLGANFLLMDQTITRLKDQGVERLNLGATPPLDKGLERFKEGWGAAKISYIEYSRRSQLKRMIDFMTRLR